MDKRVIVYGDIHGCLDELIALRSKIKPTENDIEIAVGDFLNKGPKSLQTLRYIKENHILSVMGNNEAKIIKYYKKYKKNGIKALEKLRSFEKEIILNMSEDDFNFISSLPYYIKISNLTIVHGGIKRGLKLDENMSEDDKKSLTLLRYYNKDFEMIPYGDIKGRYKFWSEVYDGSEGFVIFGHHAFSDVKIEKYAISVDTSCVYGKKLTAIVFKYDKDSICTKEYKIYQQEAFKNYFC